MKNKLRLSSGNRKLLPVYITFFVFMIINLVMDPSIMSNYKRLWPLSLQFVPLMLCAMSQTSIMLVGGINLALGPAVSLMTTIAAVVMRDGFFGTTTGVLIVLGAGILTGVIMGAVVVYGRLPDIIVTLSFSYIWKGIALFILPTPGGHIPPAYVKIMGNGKIFPIAFAILAVVLLSWGLFRKTKLGLNIYAVGGNKKAAFGNGINVRRTKLMAYGIGGLLIGIAGLVVVGQTSSGDPNIANVYSMNSIAAAVLGGVGFTGAIGQMKGAVMGAFIFTSIVNILFFSGVSPFFQYIVQGGILVVAIGLNAISYYRKGGERD
ncbi:MAG: ABC transporter permease [Oscillospiraceae bacterium]